MPKKKDKKIITGTGKDPENKLMVQKSRPLFALWRSDLSLAEFKILDTYLSRINSHNPEARTVVFEKGELEELLGVKRINTDDLKARLRNLMQPIFLPQEKGFKGITLFEEADCRKDEKTELWTVSLECTRKAMKYFFDIEELGYLRYKLRSITNLKSRYTYILFTYLEANRYRKTWEVPLDELKELLNCEQDDLYKEYKRFNERILKRCQKELHDKTECRYSYEPIKKGKTVVAIRFTLETLIDILPDPLDNELPGQQRFAALDGNDTIAFLSGACGDEFTKEQMEVIFTLINLKELPDHPQGIDFARYHYLQRQYALLNMQAARNHIKNRFNYFKSMLENDN